MKEVLPSGNEGMLQHCVVLYDKISEENIAHVLAEESKTEVRKLALQLLAPTPRPRIP